MKVNGTVETRRARKLVWRDRFATRVVTMGDTFNVEPSTLQAPKSDELNLWA